MRSAFGGARLSCRRERGKGERNLRVGGHSRSGD